MCGIAAIISIDDRAAPIDTAILERMAASLAGRGPDATGIWIAPNSRLALLNRRLATQDGRSIAHQPSWSHDRAVVAVMNGEIYNHRRLRSELEALGFYFTSDNDTEVLANAYLAWGPDMLSHLKGQFAFVCYNKSTRQVLVARDPYGISPLYYACFGGYLVVASTPSTIFLQPGLERRMDPQAVTDFFIQDSVGDERTLFSGIKHLRAGHALSFEAGSAPCRKRYYPVGNELFARDSSISVSQWIEAIRCTLETAIDECMAGDKEVGIYLSGGIDSLSLLAMLKRSRPYLEIQTFSAGFVDMASHQPTGELAFAAEMARHFNTHHHEILVSAEQVVDAIGSYDIPPSSVIDTVVGQLASAAAENGVNVALSGEGADEMFFGYDHYMAVVAQMDPNFAWLGQRYSLRGSYASALSKDDVELTDIFLGGGANIDWDNARRMVFGSGAEGTRSVRNGINELVGETFDSDGQQAGIDQQLIYIDYSQKVPENLLRRAEGPSMGRGVEMRFPFLSDDLVRLMYRLPMAHRIGDGSTKYVLRQLMSGLLPDAVLNRPKSPFGLPAARREHFKGAGLDFRQPAFRELFHRHLGRVRESLLDGAFVREQIFNPKFVERLLAPQSDLETCSFDGSLWKLWNVAEWYAKQIR